MYQTLNNTKPQIAWAIFLKEEGNDEYMFHSAHWSKARAKDMTCEDWKKPKIVKIIFTFVSKPIKE